MSYNTPETSNIKAENDFASDGRETDASKPRYKKRTPRRPRKITKSYLHNSGLYYLERFAASKAHFKTVMKRKVKRSCLYHTDQDYDECAEMVDALADKFEELGLLNDALYTRGCVEGFRRRGLSRSAILNKMRVKGIDRDATLEVLNHIDAEIYDGEDLSEKRSALKLARKKKLGPYVVEGKTNHLDDNEKRKAQQRALGAFARAGFSYALSRWVLDLVPEDLDKLDIDLLR